MRALPSKLKDLLKYPAALTLLFFVAIEINAQSRRIKGYSEITLNGAVPSRNEEPSEADEIRIDTELVLIPLRIRAQKGLLDSPLTIEDFTVFENSVPQKLAYFTGTDSPFSLILLIDTSYSTVFKASQIKEAAGRFIDLLGPQDQVAIVAFDQKPRILCKLTSNRRALEIALDAIETGSGTSLYDAIRLSVYNLLGGSRGKKAIVLLTDGVDTTSGITNAARVLQSVNEEDATVYVLSYPTFKDVQKLAKKDAEIVYDEDDNRRIVFNPPAKGERAEDYLKGEKFLKQLATSTGGELYEIKSQTDLGTAFARVADELRKTYLIGYYPSVNRTAGTQYRITIRINRPNLKISVRDKAVLRESNPDNKIN